MIFVVLFAIAVLVVLLLVNRRLYHPSNAFVKSELESELAYDFWMRASEQEEMLAFEWLLDQLRLEFDEALARLENNAIGLGEAELLSRDAEESNERIRARLLYMLFAPFSQSRLNRNRIRQQFYRSLASAIRWPEESRSWLYNMAGREEDSADTRQPAARIPDWVKKEWAVADKS